MFSNKDSKKSGSTNIDIENSNWASTAGRDNFAQILHVHIENFQSGSLGNEDLSNALVEVLGWLKKYQAECVRIERENHSLIEENAKLKRCLKLFIDEGEGV